MRCKFVYKFVFVRVFCLVVIATVHWTRYRTKRNKIQVVVKAFFKLSMSLKVHPTGVSSVTSKELREIQKLHELGKKYWVSTK